MSRRRFLAAASALAIAPIARGADPYPAKPIRLLVGYPPGGAVDLVARTIGQALAAEFGQPVVIENKPGASTSIAVKTVVDAAPDGYTLMLSANSLASNAALFDPPPFDPERDVAPVALICRVPVVLAADPGSEYTSLAKLVAAAKAKPGEINYATPGNGATPHFAVELFTRAAGIRLAHIPYKGGAAAITGVLGGQLPLVAVNAAEIVSHAKAGKLRVLAAFSAKRTGVLPDVPTIAESGFPGFEASVWYGIIAPAKTPAPIVARLTEAVRKSIAQGDVAARLSAVGGEVGYGTPAEFAALIRSERARYVRVAREANIKPD